jgi:hypothetical protein
MVALTQMPFSKLLLGLPAGAPACGNKSQGFAIKQTNGHAEG